METWRFCWRCFYWNAEKNHQDLFKQKPMGKSDFFPPNNFDHQDGTTTNTQDLKFRWVVSVPHKDLSGDFQKRVSFLEKKNLRESLETVRFHSGLIYNLHAPCDPCLASWEYPSISHQTGRQNHLTSYREAEDVSSVESSHLHERKFHRTKRELLAASKTTSKKPLPLISNKSRDILSCAKLLC